MSAPHAPTPKDIATQVLVAGGLLFFLFFTGKVLFFMASVMFPSDEPRQVLSAVAPEAFVAEAQGLQATHEKSGGLQGTSKSPGLTIYWAGMTSQGATPRDVIRAAINRMQFEQGMEELASNEQAKALVNLIQADRVLSGEPEVTDDGDPILE